VIPTSQRGDVFGYIRCNEGRDGQLAFQADGYPFNSIDRNILPSVELQSTHPIHQLLPIEEKHSLALPHPPTTAAVT
jgi:hypothetical protein